MCGMKGMGGVRIVNVCEWSVESSGLVRVEKLGRWGGERSLWME